MARKVSLMISSPKEILAKSKMIRRYLLLWAVFIAGVLIMLPFLKTTSALRYISLAGFLLSAGSFCGAILWMTGLDPEIRYFYPNAIGRAKRFLFGLFYFSRLPILFLGLFILVSVTYQKEIYLSLNDYQFVASAGNIVGVIMGIFFSVSGLIFLLTGRIYKYKP